MLAGMFKGFMDALRFHYRESFFRKFKNEQFWNPKISWVNKYNRILFDEGMKVPKFTGSTTYFVWLTDGFHLLQMIYLNLLFLASGVMFTTDFVLIGNKFISIIVVFFVLAILFKTVFEITYGLSYSEKIYDE